MSGPFNVRAVVLGLAVNIGTTLALTVLGFFVGGLIEVLGITVISWSMRLIGLAGDFGGGLVAGHVAGRDGAVHGVTAGALGAALGLGIGAVRLLAPGIELPAGYWLQVVAWTGFGVALSLVGGALGAQGRRSA